MRKGIQFMSDTNTSPALRKTPLHSRHVALKANMSPFAGYDMPIEYEHGIVHEHMAVREKVGLFDVAHMGDLLIRGPRALEVLQAVSAHDAAALQPGQVQYSYMPFPHEKGCGIVDDFLVFHLAEGIGGYLIVPNAANYEEVYQRIVEHGKTLGLEELPCGATCPSDKTTIEDASPRIGQLALQGPRALEVAQKLTETTIIDMTPNHYRKVTLAGHKGILISTTGYTGAGGCEVYAYTENIPSLWDALLEAGKEFDIEPCGLGARDSLRLEAGFCLYGHELSKERTPYAAGLGWCTKLIESKENLMGRKELEALKAKGSDPLKLVSFVMDKKGPSPRPDYVLYAGDKDHIGADTPCGVVTSGGPSPCLGLKGIGMGYLPRAHAKVGMPITVEIPSRREGGKPRLLGGTIVKSALSVWEEEKKA